MNGKPAAQNDIAPSLHAFRLTLSQVNDLFNAPAANPFAGGESEVLGVTGVDYLHRRLKRPWPRSADITQLVLVLPAQTLPADPGARMQLAAETERALQHLCTAKIATNQHARRVAMRTSGRQLLASLLWMFVAIGLTVAVANGWLSILPPFVQGVVVVLGMLAASLAIWDSADALFFRWAPFEIDNRAYRTMANLQVQIEPARDAA